jgi:hypothetical protein
MQSKRRHDEIEALGGERKQFLVGGNPQSEGPIAQACERIAYDQAVNLSAREQRARKGVARRAEIERERKTPGDRLQTPGDIRGCALEQEGLRPVFMRAPAALAQEGTVEQRSSHRTFHMADVNVALRRFRR